MSALNTEYDLVITNGVCVTASDIAALDLAIKDEKIILQAPSGSLAQANAKRVIDAEGGYVMVSFETTNEISQSMPRDEVDFFFLCVARRYRLSCPSRGARHLHKRLQWPVGRQLGDWYPVCRGWR